MRYSSLKVFNVSNAQQMKQSSFHYWIRDQRTFNFIHYFFFFTNKQKANTSFD